MQAVIGIVVLLAIGWIIYKLKNLFWKTASQKVFYRGRHEEGQTLTTTAVLFATTLESATVLESVKVAVGLNTGVQSAVLGQLYIASEDATGLTFVSGSKIGTSFRSRLSVTSSGTGTTGEYKVLNWTLNDGIVSDVEQMRFLRRKVTETLRLSDPSVQLSDPIA